MEGGSCKASARTQAKERRHRPTAAPKGQRADPSKDGPGRGVE